MDVRKALQDFEKPNFYGYSKSQIKYFKAVIKSINKRLKHCEGYTVTQAIDTDYYGIGILDHLGNAYRKCGFEVESRNLCIKQITGDKKALEQGLLMIRAEKSVY